jgi:ribosomal peptide maturation radical SAM protein 1
VSTDVVFVVMPFADIGRPAIGVSLLKAAVQKAGYSATIRYCNIEWADIIGLELYQKVSNGFPPELLVGEWCFADDVFGQDVAPAEDYIMQVLSRAAPTDVIGELAKSKLARDPFVDGVVDKVLALAPRVVGFTSTFHQTCPSLAVARRLKAMPNPPVIVFGGANCEGEMGVQMVRSFPWIDYVCTGEADRSFVHLLHHLLRAAPGLPPGVLQRGVSDCVPPAERVEDMDSLPFPDYDDYFASLKESTNLRSAAYHLVVETSRGCWWGAKHHCTFCGLNGETMAFRSKSPERAFDEMAFLSCKYGLQRISSVDNILDMHYIGTLFPHLAESDLDLELFYEVKSNLRYDQLLLLHRGGMRQIQPGIESFSDQVLKLMKKGVSAFQNVQLMRWCEELGIECIWNLLAGFPGELPSEYKRMAELIPLLTHLRPPGSCAQVRLDRFSPFHTRADDFGFCKIRAARAYFFVFPLGRAEMSRLAYFFDFDYGDGRDVAAYMQPVQKAVDRWWQRFLDKRTRPRLDATFDDEAVIVSDTRDIAVARESVLSGLDARVLALCDVAATVPSLMHFTDTGGDEHAVRDALDRLLQLRLVARDGDQHVALPVFRNRPANLPTRRPHARIPLAAAAAA